MKLLLSRCIKLPEPGRAAESGCRLASAADVADSSVGPDGCLASWLTANKNNNTIHDFH